MPGLYVVVRARPGRQLSSIPGECYDPAGGFMRQKLVIGLVLLAFSGLAHAQSEAKRAQVSDEYLGVLAGTWG